jgi:hypothetical protein
MIRSIKLGKVRRQKYTDDIGITIEIDDRNIPTLCLNLCLLERSLVDTIDIRDNDSNTILAISRSLHSKKGGQNIVRWEGEKALLDVVPRELDYWLHWFLKYYRDGVADVNHIDVEATGSGKSLSLMYKIAHTRPPMSEVEARKLLDMN